MSTAEHPAVLPLEAGQHLGRREFHALYQAMPPGIKCELIGGVVHMPSPVGNRHADDGFLAASWLGHYALRTPGVRGADNASTALDENSEVQPDLSLRILPESGGQTRTVGGILDGCPELVVEISHSSRAVDLGPKLSDYDRAGAIEYVVFAIEPDEVIWHARREGRLVRVGPDQDGVYRSAGFPGLWLDPAAFLADDGPGVVATLERGLGSLEHGAFVARLARPGRSPDHRRRPFPMGARGGNG